MIQSNLGLVHAELGEHAAALDRFARALEIYEAALGPDNVQIVPPLTGVGEMHGLLGDHQAARRHLERVVAIDERVLGPQAPAVSYPLYFLARTAAAQDRHDEAAALLTRTLVLREAGEFPADQIAEVRVELARAQWRQATDRAQAVVTMPAARAELERAGVPGDDTRLALARAWPADERTRLAQRSRCSRSAAPRLCRVDSEVAGERRARTSSRARNSRLLTVPSGQASTRAMSATRISSQ